MNVSEDGIVLELPKDQLGYAQNYADEAKRLVERANRTYLDALFQEDDKRRAEEAAKERVRQVMRLVRF